VLGRLAGEVRERVLAAPGWAGRFAVLEEFLARRVRGAQAPRGAGPRPEVSYAWDRLQQSRGAGQRWPTSPPRPGGRARHLGAEFRAETGLSPKAGARVIRFDLARRHLLRRPPAGGGSCSPTSPPNAATTTRRTLAREFRDLAGCPPSVLLAEEFRNVQAGLDGDWE